MLGLYKTPPYKTYRPRETLWTWGDDLAVEVLTNGEIGQFTTSFNASRSEVEALIKHWT